MFTHIICLVCTDSTHNPCGIYVRYVLTLSLTAKLYILNLCMYFIYMYVYMLILSTIHYLRCLCTVGPIVGLAISFGVTLVTMTTIITFLTIFCVILLKWKGKLKNVKGL